MNLPSLSRGSLKYALTATWHSVQCHVALILRGQTVAVKQTLTTESMLKKSLGGNSVLGRQPRWIEIVRDGLPFTALQQASDFWRIESSVLSKIVGLSSRTLARRNSDSRPLTSEQSERVYRFCKIMATASSVLEDRDKALSWIQTPNTALNKARPIELLDTGIGFQQVLDVLNRIEYGVYS